MSVVTVVSLFRAGGPYTTDYVHRLQSAVEKYLPEAKFVCLSDVGMEGVDTIPIERQWDAWCEIELFEKFTEGTTLYIDLGVIIKDSLTPFIPKITSADLLMVTDFANNDYLSSCVMCWKGDHSYIAEKFNEHPGKWIEEYRPEKGPWKSGNSQKFIEDTAKDPRSFDYSLVSSYKLSSKRHISESVIVNYHGNPKPHEVNWNIYRPDLRPKFLHVTNWGIWGGIQSVVLSLSKELKEVDHAVLQVNSKNAREDCAAHFANNGIQVLGCQGKVFEDYVKKINPDVIFFHNTPKSALVDYEKWNHKYTTVRVFHNAMNDPYPTDLTWAVSDWVARKVKGSSVLVLPPCCYVYDFLNIKRPYRAEPVVGRIQSTTNIGKGKYSEKFFDMLREIGGKQFVVGHADGDAPVKPGLMQEYLKEIDIMVMWGNTTESSSLVMTEANLSGIPVVLRNMNDGAAEKLKESGGGILVNTPEEFIEAVNRLKADSVLRAELAEAGRKWNIENSGTHLIREVLNSV